MSKVSYLFFLGKKIAIPAPGYLFDALENIEVQESDDGFSGFQINFNLKKTAQGFLVDYKGLAELAPFNRIIIGTKIDNTIKYVICPKTNAYADFDRILEEITKNDTRDLILMSCGATASVLAYELAIKGYTAMDIGVLPSLYNKMVRINAN